MADRSISVKLRADIAGYMASMRSAGMATKELGDRISKNEQLANMAGRGMVAFGTGMLAGLGMATKAAIDWESAWAGVQKTVDGSPEQMAALEGELRGLAKTLPATHDEIAGVAEAAGQLGIKRKSIAEFTETMVALGETTNLSAEEAATSLARFGNIMGTSQDDVDRLGSVLVDLGNNAATTEAEILTLGTRLAAAGDIAGLSEADVMAFASTLTSVGVEAEAGGTALSKVFTKVRDAVLDGGDELQTFAEVAGVSAQKFARSFKDDPATAIASFIAGLGRMNDAGKSTTQIFDDLNLTDQRLMRALLSTAGAGDLLTEQLKRGNKAWEENTALTEEAQKRYDTAASKITVAWNNIKDAAIDIGSSIAPMIGGLAETVGDLADAFGRLPGPVKSALGPLMGIIGTASLVGGGLLLLLPRIASTKAAMSELGFSFDKTRGRGSRMASSLGRVGGALTVLSLAGAGVNAAFGNKTTTANMEALTVGLERWADQSQISGEAARFLGDKAEDLQYDLEQLTSWSNFAAGPAQGLGEFLSFGKYVGPITKAEERLNLLGETLGQMVREGDGEQAAAIFQLIAAKANAAGMSTDELLEHMAPYSAAQEVAADKTKETADEIGKIPGAVEQADPAMESLARHFALAVEDAEEAGKAVTEMTDKWAEAFAEFAPPLEAYQNVLERKEKKEQESAQATADSTKRSSDSWEDYAGNVKVTVKEYFAELRKMTRAQRDWAKNMVTLAARVPADVLDYLAQLGPEGAGQVQLLTRMTDKEMRNWIKMMRNSGQVGGQEFAARLKDAQPVLQAIADQLGQGVANKIAAGMAKRGTTVSQEAKRQGIRIDKGVGVDDIRVVKVSADAQRAMDRLKFFKDNANRLLNDIDDRTVTIDANLRFGGAGTGATASNRLLSSTGRAEGGILPGSPSSKDNMLVPMASGEYVVRASEVRKNLPLLEAINSGRGFAQGGLVNLNVNARSSMGTTRSDMIDAIQKHGQDNWLSFLPSGGGSVGAGVERWRGVAMQALALAGSPMSWIGSLLRRMNQESGGNPMAINLWDSNAAAGIPSKGLMQTIDPTFNAYAGFLRGRGVWDPLANIFASINYANARYGAAPIGWNQPGGYAEGGQLPGSPSGRDNMVVRAASGEYIVNADATSKNLPLLEAINSGSLEGFASGGLVKRRKAMREILSHLRGGGNLFEDFTFKGMSKLVDRFSTELSKTFHRTGREFSRKAIAGFLDARLPNPRQGMRSLARAEQPLFGDKKAARFDRLIDRFKGILPNSDDPLRKQLREMNKTMRSLSKLLHKADAHWFGRRVMQVRERMANLLKRRERIDDRLEKAISIRDKRISQRRDVAGGLRSAIFEQRNMVGGFGIDHDGSFNASDIAGQLEENLAKTRKFQRLLRQMRRKGFRANVIGQIAQAGPEEGMETAEALADSSKSEVQRINRSFVGIHKAAHNFSQEIGRKLYGAGIQAARGLVKGLRSRRRQIQRTMRDIARSLLRHMRRSLKIQSPSQEMAKLGDMTGQGFVAGLDRSMGGVRKVMDRRVTDMTRLRPFVPGQHGGYGRGDVHLTVNLHAPHFVGSNEDLVRVLRTEIRSNDTIRRELKKALNA